MQRLVEAEIRAGVRFAQKGWTYASSSSSASRARFFPRPPPASSFLMPIILAELPLRNARFSELEIMEAEDDDVGANTTSGTVGAAGFGASVLVSLVSLVFFFFLADWNAAACQNQPIDMSLLIDSPSIAPSSSSLSLTNASPAPHPSSVWNPSSSSDSRIVPWPETSESPSLSSSSSSAAGFGRPSIDRVCASRAASIASWLDPASSSSSSSLSLLLKLSSLSLSLSAFAGALPLPLLGAGFTDFGGFAGFDVALGLDDPAGFLLSAPAVCMHVRWSRHACGMFERNQQQIHSVHDT